MHLSSQLSSKQHTLQLTPEDWYWLRHKRSLTLGVACPCALPMDMIYNNGDYEGISADVVSLLKQQLGIDVNVVRFDRRQDALDALASGKVDFISRSSDDRQPHSGTALSMPYALNAPSLYRRQTDDRPWSEDLNGVSLAMAKDYLPAAFFKTRYPDARLHFYSNSMQAMAAVAFQDVDAYAGDSLSTHYLVENSFFNYIKFERFIDLKPGGYGFLLRAQEPRLMGILNGALHSLGPLKMGYLIKRWTGAESMMPEDRVILTEQERRWLVKHPVARLMINDDMAPSAFFDANGRFNGVISDLFELITQRTGLQFKVLRTASFEGTQQAVSDNEADLAILTPSVERQDLFRFSHPFATSSFALVTASGEHDLTSLKALAGKRLAIAKRHVLGPSIARDYPDIVLSNPQNNLQAMSQVVNGKADAAVMALTMAHYYTARLYENKLRIAAILDTEAATASFAMRRSDMELQSILDKAIMSIAPEELNAMTARWRANAAMSGQSWRDSGWVIVQVVGCALLILTISMVRILQLRRQIRRRVAAEKALHDQLEFLQTLNDTMPIPIYVRDREGRLLSCSRSYEQVMNLRQADILGKTALQMPIEHFEAALTLHRCYLQAMDRGVAIEQQCEVILDGEHLCIDHWIQPFRDSSGTIKGVICGWQDVTEHRRLVNDLQQAKIQADEASKAKTHFLATMSHEIRTPMSAVIGTLEMALKRADQGILDRSNIDVAYTCAKNLLELLGNTLDIVRIESGRLSFSPQRTRLKDLVEPVVRVFDGLARRKLLRLDLEIDAGASSDVLVDPLRLKQVLSNLVSNAIKFTEQGSVSIRISSHVDPPRTLNVRLQVTDTGCGLSQADQQLLFQPFAQVGQSTLTVHGGSGLGLVVARSLCEMMGGSLHIHSQVGQGTTVSVELKLKLLDPLTQTDALPLPVTPLAVRNNPHVLVVDDNRLSRHMLLAQLEFLGCTAIEAANGHQALDLWRHTRFDLLITDYHMPGLDGVALAIAIREQERQLQRAPLPILGLTADAQPEEIARCINAGMADCLIKPASLGQLEERLCAMLPRDLTSQTQPAPTSTANSKGVLSPLHKLSMGNPAILEQLSAELIRSIHEDREQLRRLSKDMDINTLAQLSHRMRSSAAIMGNKHLLALCKTMEMTCKSHLQSLRERAHEIDEELLHIETAVALNTQIQHWQQ